MSRLRVFVRNLTTPSDVRARRMYTAKRMYTHDMNTPSLETVFQALADRTRLRILGLLAEGELCVCYFVEILGEPQPKISRHLAYLRRAGLVSARREGKWMHYKIAEPADPHIAGVLVAALHAASAEKQIQKDRTALDRACCGVRVPAALQNAPKPEIRN